MRTHDEVQELLGAYALHAVEPDEAEIVERHLEGCPRCRSEVAGHREVATLLGNTGGDAPEGLWERISNELEESPPPMRLTLPGSPGNVVPLAPRRRTAPRVISLAIGAAAAVAIGLLGVQVLDQQQQLDEFEEAVEEGTKLSLATRALRNPDGVQARLSSIGDGINGTAVLLPDGTGFLMAHELPALEDGRIYQLWGRTESGLISLGLLGAQPGVVSFQASDAIAALAVTAEVAGGVPSSQNVAVLAGEFD